MAWPNGKCEVASHEAPYCCPQQMPMMLRITGLLIDGMHTRAAGERDQTAIAGDALPHDEEVTHIACVQRKRPLQMTARS